MDLFGFEYVCFKCFLVLSLLALGCQVKGQDRSNYVTDTLVVMDAPAFNEWVKRQPANLALSARRERARDKIKQYISLVIRQANVRLESLTDDTNDWTVELSVADFLIGEDPLGGTVNILTKSIHHQSAINTVKFWVAAQTLDKQYDYVILMTGYNLVGDSNLPYDIKGVANIGRLCETDGTSVAIVEDRGGFQSGHFIAHEFGHSLGSFHDGEESSATCLATDRYLMAINAPEVTSSNKLNPWYFSRCSKSVIGNHIAKNILQTHPTCLTENKPPAQEFEQTKNQLPGQVYDVKAQCQHLYGPQSTVCLSDKFKLSEVCTSMQCLDPSSPYCYQHWAADGSSCGEGKICQKGECVESVLAPNTKFSDCYFGDEFVTIGGQTCSQSVAKSPSICYQPNVLTACCKSCGEAKTQIAACPFGDKKSGCHPDDCKRILPDGTRVEEVCCQTCQYNDVTDCVDTLLVDGVSCEERVTQNGVQGCYDTSVAYLCCSTCARLRENVTGCEYGDLTTGSTCRRLAYDKQTCQQYKDQCCHTCNNLDVGSSGRLQSFVYIYFIAVCVFVVL